MQSAIVGHDNYSICEIDGQRFTECVGLDDDAEVKSHTKWEDIKLITIVENVDVYVAADGFKSILYSSGPLQGRIKINGKIQ